MEQVSVELLQSVAVRNKKPLVRLIATESQLLLVIEYVDSRP